MAKPTEFGTLITIQEAEHQIVTAYEVHATHLADVTLWTPALDRHQAIFGRAPDLAAGDRGFSSAANEQAATVRGVRRVVLPHRGPKSSARRAHERQRWFRRGQRWRVGCEGRISVLKRRQGLRRCRYHGLDGMHRWVGLGVIADNLINIAKFQPHHSRERIPSLGELPGKSPVLPRLIQPSPPLRASRTSGDPSSFTPVSAGPLRAPSYG